MRNLLKILGVGFVVFMTLSIAQEWELFSTAWFGNTPDKAELSEDDRKAASDTLHLMLNLMGHLYSSGGDPRFTERLPASGGVVDEILADVAYLTRNQRRQEMVLERLDVVGMESLDERRLEVRTRESWRVRHVAVGTQIREEQTTAQAWMGRYLLVRDLQGWRVEAWQAIHPTWREDPAAS